MKIIISPSKTLKPNAILTETKEPLFIEKANFLKDILLSYNAKQIETHLHVSKKLSEEIYLHLKETKTYPALFYYTGTVFKQLELSHYQTKQFSYLQEHLYILDALYGCLRYNDAISFYRLDFLCQLDDIDLYKYWQSSLKTLLMEEDLIINLASNEYAKQIHHANMITIDFCIQDHDKIKRPSALIKKARGQMLNILILNQITQLDKIKSIEFDGYHFDPQRSTPSKYVFIKSA